MNKSIKHNFKKVAASFLATAALMGSGAASATLVTQWGYNLDSGFVNAGPLNWTDDTGAIGAASAVSGSNLNANLGLPTTLTWGTSTGFGRSSISVGAPTGNMAGVNLFTNAPAIPTVNFAHTNQPILGATLRTASLLDVLTLQPLNPLAGALPSLQLLFGINFTETPNSGSCVVASPTPCNDIFVISLTGGAFGPGNSIQQVFTYDLQRYVVSLTLTGLNNLSNAACAAAGAAAGCKGFTTEEGRVNNFGANLALNAVPEPGTMALLGLGLFGLGAVARRRKM